ncbi:hypothetical protein CNMCM8980_000871 [Aspergillus fumigatiaffinis]|nr:hypothetical protein CNMCM8980_000871 [Aspergillus fumigatiaffinis]
MSHRSEPDLPSPRAVNFDFTKRPELHNLRQPARIPLFPSPSTLPDFMFEPLEPHDATESYFRTKVRSPATRDCTGDWAFLNMLLSKAIRQISFGGPIRNVNTYYYKDESALTPGALVLLTAHRYHRMAPREYPLTAAYAKFVNAGLITHIGQGGKQADLPAGIKNATQDLTPNQKNIIITALADEVDRILKEESAVLDMGPKYQGTSEDAKKFLQDVLELAEKVNMPDAHAALEKVKSFSFTALKKEDMGKTPPVASSEQAAPGVTSPEEGAPGVASPEEAAPGVNLPEEAAPGVTSPEEAAPGHLA